MLLEIKSLNIIDMTYTKWNPLKRITETEVKFIKIRITETETKRMHVRK